jgi:hypothetical protein
MATKRIKMLTSLAGDAYVYNAGEEYEVEEPFARALCGEPPGDPRAEPVGWSLTGAKREKATRDKRETATAAAPEGH